MAQSVLENNQHSNIEDSADVKHNLLVSQFRVHIGFERVLDVKAAGYRCCSISD